MAMGIQERYELDEFKAAVNSRLDKLEKKINGNGQVNGDANGDTDVGTRLMKLEELVNSVNGSVSYIKGQLKGTAQKV